MFKRIILVVLDSVGIGELPDAKLYGDVGSNTLKNTAKAVGGLNLPNLEKMGLGNIEDIMGVLPCDRAIAGYGKLAEMSAGKDTTMGHWEIAGIISKTPFPVYPDGFPMSLINEFERQIERKIIGNKAASGTEIINELGKLHLRTGSPIVYTSADSVFQIAAHEHVIPVEKLYEICKVARMLLTPPNGVARVIARPFIGSPGSFKRTEKRKDFSLNPPRNTVLDFAIKNGFEVVAIGKIHDIFNGQGISKTIKTKNNSDGVNKLINEMENNMEGIIFINLVDFDMLYGHRNNPQGYADALEDFDDKLPKILANLKSNDLLIITADHGCDPTTNGTDHSREYVPLLVYNNRMKRGTNLGTRETFADIAATIADILNFDGIDTGKSFKNEIEMTLKLKKKVKDKNVNK
ncbi:MAG TPA: phosphopentomutase [Thermoanaerobacterales bacterium]|nr:phosphopentomutase [Thermoanaerobacterales bacterium]